MAGGDSTDFTGDTSPDLTARGTVFRRTNLHGPDFNGDRLQATLLCDANLRRTRSEQTTLHHVEPHKARLGDVGLTTADTTTAREDA